MKVVIRSVNVGTTCVFLIFCGNSCPYFCSLYSAEVQRSPLIAEATQSSVHEGGNEAEMCVIELRLLDKTTYSYIC